MKAVFNRVTSMQTLVLASAVLLATSAFAVNKGSVELMGKQRGTDPVRAFLLYERPIKRLRLFFRRGTLPSALSELRRSGALHQARGFAMPAAYQRSCHWPYGPSPSGLVVQLPYADGLGLKRLVRPVRKYEPSYLRQDLRVR